MDTHHAPPPPHTFSTTPHGSQVNDNRIGVEVKGWNWLCQRQMCRNAPQSCGLGCDWWGWNWLDKGKLGPCLAC